MAPRMRARRSFPGQGPPADGARAPIRHPWRRVRVALGPRDGDSTRPSGAVSRLAADPGADLRGRPSVLARPHIPGPCIPAAFFPAGFRQGRAHPARRHPYRALLFLDRSVAFHRARHRADRVHRHHHRRIVRRLSGGTDNGARPEGLPGVLPVFLHGAGVHAALRAGGAGDAAPADDDIVGMAFSSFPYVDYEQRMGLNRIQTVFEHPILSGLFWSVGIGDLFFSTGTGWPWRCRRPASPASRPPWRSPRDRFWWPCCNSA